MNKTIYILSLLVSMLSFSQEKLITGIITDDSNKTPISYASVGVENGQSRTFANEEGRFILRNVMPEKRLVFTALGYEKLILGAKNISDTICLNPVKNELSEVQI